MTQTKRKNVIIAVYVILFFGIWSAVELLLTPFLNRVIGNETVVEILKESVIKLSVWTVPAFLLVRRYQADVFVPLKEMFTAKVKWLKYLPAYAAVTLFVLSANLLQNGRIMFSTSIQPGEFVGSVLFAGITEEAVFRGWLLNACVRDHKKWPAVLLNAALFLAIHFPIWIRTGVFINVLTSVSFLIILGLGVLLSWTFIKSRNLLAPITLHMYYNLLVCLFLS